MARPKTTTVNKASQATPAKFTTIHEWMSHQGQQDLLRFITCGSVDDGKSTLIGRLLGNLYRCLTTSLAPCKPTQNGTAPKGRISTLPYLLMA